MSTSSYGTANYHRLKMYDSLGVAIVSLIAVALQAYFHPDEPYGYVFAVGIVIGIKGFFEHRRKMLDLRRKEELRAMARAYQLPTLVVDNTTTKEKP